MTPQHFIEHYGYWALIVGTLLEGETILVIAGFAAHRGYMSLPWVILAAFAGSVTGDQLYFFIGRTKGKEFLERRPAWRSRIGRVNRLLERHATLLTLGFRFVYGIRTVTPFVLGTSAIPSSRFVVLNAAAGMAWAAAVGGGGYLFGAALESIFRDVKRFEIEAMAAIGACGAVLYLAGYLRGRRRRGG